jgi:hypothetical protein
MFEGKESKIDSEQPCVGPKKAGRPQGCKDKEERSKNGYFKRWLNHRLKKKEARAYERRN